jgi:acetyl-CoA/propionyl-CoA carboxylase biotin carboxyl carrier protein
VYAEDPARGFLPAAGARVDTGVGDGSVVSSVYDPMLAKVIVHAADRTTALRRLDAALADYHLLGITTNVPFLRALLAHPDVRAGDLDTGLVERVADDLDLPGVDDHVLVAAAMEGVLDLEPPDVARADPFDVPDGWRVGEHAWTTWRLTPLGGDPVVVCTRGRARAAQVRVGEGEPRSARAWRESPDVLVVAVEEDLRRYRVAHDGEIVWLGSGGATWGVRETATVSRAATEEAGGGPLVAPMPGTVAAVHVAEGDDVAAGQTLLVVEAMKMEHPVTAPVDGVVAALHVAAGDQVGMEQPLALVTAAEEG